MANELRKWENWVGGLVEDNPLAAAATTLTSAGLAALPAVGSTEHMLIVFDPDGLTGAPFAKRVTAHTAAATTATIDAAAIIGTARAIDRDVPWVHAMVAADLWQPAYDKIATSQNTTSGAFGNLTTTGPTAIATVPSSGKVKVTLSARIKVNITAGTGWMGVDLSGANTVAANQGDALAAGGVLLGQQLSYVFVLSGLTAGITTFTAKYRIDDSAGSVDFANRFIIVEPMAGV